MGRGGGHGGGGGGGYRNISCFCGLFKLLCDGGGEGPEYFVFLWVRIAVLRRGRRGCRNILYFMDQDSCSATGGGRRSTS